MSKPVDKKLLFDAAVAAQKKRVFSQMLEHYAGGGRRILAQHRFLPSCAGIFAVSLEVDCSDATKRRYMDGLAEAGEVRREKVGNYVGAPVRYFFPRSLIDTFVAASVTHWEAAGYSQHETRPEVKEGASAADR